jgi:hypothetical protein
LREVFLWFLQEGEHVQSGALRRGNVPEPDLVCDDVGWGCLLHRFFLLLLFLLTCAFANRFFRHSYEEAVLKVKL